MVERYSVCRFIKSTEGTTYPRTALRSYFLKEFDTPEEAKNYLVDKIEENPGCEFYIIPTFKKN